MNERTRILNMVSDGKITAAEAEKLLDALDVRRAKEQETVEFKDKRGRKNKKFRVNIDTGETGGNAKVNIGVPISLMRAFGPFITKNIPDEAKEEMGRCGFDLTEILQEINKATENAADEDIVNIGADEEDPAKIKITVE